MRQKRVLTLALAVLLALLCLPGKALAYDWPEKDVAERLCSLTMNGKQAGVTFRAYRICTVDQRVRFRPTKDFAGLEGLEALCEAGSWKTLEAALPRYMADKTIAPTQTKVADENGVCRFEDLPTGLYWVTGYLALPNGKIFQTSPSLLCLPNWLEAGDPGNTGADAKDRWVYDVVATPKGAPTESPDKIKVVKRWPGVPARERLESITVELWKIDPDTKRGELYRTVTLSQSNSWQNLWTGLPEGWEWEVRETDGSQGFRVSYDWVSLSNVTISNSRPTTPPPDPKDPPKNDPDPDPNPDPKDPPPPDGPPNIPSEELEDSPPPLTRPPMDDDTTEEDWEPEEEEEIDDDGPPLTRLPQTGVLWWPVPFLAMGGMFLFVLGWVLDRRARDDEE